MEVQFERRTKVDDLEGSQEDEPKRVKTKSKRTKDAAQTKKSSEAQGRASSRSGVYRNKGTPLTREHEVVVMILDVNEESCMGFHMPIGDNTLAVDRKAGRGSVVPKGGSVVTVLRTPVMRFSLSLECEVPGPGL